MSEDIYYKAMAGIPFIRKPDVVRIKGGDKDNGQSLGLSDVTNTEVFTVCFTLNKLEDVYKEALLRKASSNFPKLLESSVVRGVDNFEGYGVSLKYKNMSKPTNVALALENKNTAEKVRQAIVYTDKYYNDILIKKSRKRVCSQACYRGINLEVSEVSDSSSSYYAGYLYISEKSLPSKLREYIFCYGDKSGSLNYDMNDGLLKADWDGSLSCLFQSTDSLNKRIIKAGVDYADEIISEDAKTTKEEIIQRLRDTVDSIFDLEKTLIPSIASKNKTVNTKH